MGLIVSAAGATGAPGTLQTSLVAVGAGALFCVIGLVMATNYRGLAHRWVRSADESLEEISLISKPLRRLNVRLFGGEANFVNHKLNVMPKIVGTSFIIMGGVAFLAGVIRLLLMA
jgi:hypothetical protein